MHKLTALQVTKTMQEISHPQRDSGLARPGGTSETHVQVRPGCRQPEPLPDPVDQEQRPDLLYPFLYRH